MSRILANKFLLLAALFVLVIALVVAALQNQQKKTLSSNTAPIQQSLETIKRTPPLATPPVRNSSEEVLFTTSSQIINQQSTAALPTYTSDAPDQLIQRLSLVVQGLGFLPQHKTTLDVNTTIWNGDGSSVLTQTGPFLFSHSKDLPSTPGNTTTPSDVEAVIQNYNSSMGFFDQPLMLITVDTNYYNAQGNTIRAIRDTDSPILLGTTQEIQINNLPLYLEDGTISQLTTFISDNKIIKYETRGPIHITSQATIDIISPANAYALLETGAYTLLSAQEVNTQNPKEAYRPPPQTTVDITNAHITKLTLGYLWLQQSATIKPVYIFTGTSTTISGVVYRVDFAVRAS